MLNDRHMRRILIALLATLTIGLVLPALAPATSSEVGVIGATTPATAPSCPSSPCLAVSRTTGFQVRVAAARNLLSVPQDRHDRRLDDLPREADRDADQVLRHQRGRRTGSRHRDPAPAEETEPRIQAGLIEPRRQTAAVLRQDRPVPARNDLACQKGRRRRTQRAHVGPGARSGLRQRHLLARQPAPDAVHEHELPEHPHGRGQRGPVLLPLPDRPPDLQRDPDLNALTLGPSRDSRGPGRGRQSWARA